MRAPRARIGVRATIAEVAYRDKDHSEGDSSPGVTGVLKANPPTFILIVER